MMKGYLKKQPPKILFRLAFNAFPYDRGVI